MNKIRIISSLEKPRPQDSFNAFPELKKLSALKGERLSFQAIHTNFDEGLQCRGCTSFLTLDGELAKYATVREVECVPIMKPVLQHSKAWHIDDNYISKEPGIFPEVLRPLHNKNQVFIVNSILQTLWVEINIPKRIKAGEYTLTLNLDTAEGRHACDTKIVIEIINEVMPDESIYYTEWFYCDCLASYYNVKMWSRRHWEIIENFMRVAVKTA